jgi:hypothetical protein
MNCPPVLAQIEQLHQTYCRLTAQNLTLRFDRQRLWYDFIQAGFTANELIRVLGYLQKEIRQSRRNVGALKLSNLLQLDRFEEDLNISQVRLTSQPPRPNPPPDAPPCSRTEQEQGRQRALQQLRELQDKLRRNLI